jgi:ATP-dependent RNA helicase MSS116
MTNAAFLSDVTFDSLPIHAATKKALLDDFKYTHLSKPQAQYISTALSGQDVFVKARTGSGKTLGFLIPLLERVVSLPKSLSKSGPKSGPKSLEKSLPKSLEKSLPKSLQKSNNGSRSNSGGGVAAIVVSPSRELAEQTRQEALRLLKHHTGIAVGTAIGGMNANEERRKMMTEKRLVLIATPGRLLDHIENAPGLAASLAKDVRVVVIDEADRMLDMGFRPALNRIVSSLPPPGKRQTLLYTATVPPGVLDVARSLAGGQQVAFLDASGGQEDGDQKRLERVEQAVAVLPVAGMPLSLFQALVDAMTSTKDHRVIVFFTTARMAGFMAHLFRKCPRLSGILEMHSRLSQSHRTRAARAFASGATRVLFASDVIARGIDFPDVTHVIQVGLTKADQYEHRTGRTGRAGKAGKALLLLGEDEAAASGLVGSLRKGGLEIVDFKPPAANATRLPNELSAALALVSTDDDLMKHARQAYSATLGFYAGYMKQLRMTPAQVVAAVNARFASLGVVEPPAIPAKTAAKMRLAGAPGLRVE